MQFLYVHAFMYGHQSHIDLDVEMESELSIALKGNDSEPKHRHSTAHLSTVIESMRKKMTFSYKHRE